MKIDFWAVMGGFPLNFLQNVDAHGSFFHADVSTAVFCQAQPGAFHLFAPYRAEALVPAIETALAVTSRPVLETFKGYRLTEVQRFRALRGG